MTTKETLIKVQEQFSFLLSTKQNWDTSDITLLHSSVIDSIIKEYFPIKKPKLSLVDKLVEKLLTLDVNDNFAKDSYIEIHWGSYDYYTERTFSVAFTKAVKRINSNKETINRQYRSIKKNITRMQ